MNFELSPRMREMLEAIADSEVSVSYDWRNERFNVTNRKGWSSSARQTFDALVRRGLIVPTGNRDHIGEWWCLSERGLRVIGGGLQ